MNHHLVIDIFAGINFTKRFFFHVVSGRGRNGEAVLHVSYKDGVCGEKWGEILKLPKSVMDQEIHRALEYKFNRKIPLPLSTVYQYWNEGAW